MKPSSSPTPPDSAATTDAPAAADFGFPTFARLARHLPEPPRALRLARLMIPLCLFVGIAAQPFAQWLMPVLYSLPLPF